MEPAKAPARRLPGVALASLPLMLLVLLVLCTFGRTASADTRLPRPPSDGPYLGALLDPSKDSPAAYRDRLHVAPAAYAYSVPVPLDGSEVDRLAATVQAFTRKGPVFC